MICAVAQCNQGRCIALKQVSGDNKKNPLPHAAGFLQASTCRPKSILCSKNGVNRQEAKGDAAG